MSGREGGGWLAEEMGRARPVIGVVHLPPLPGSPRGEPGTLDRVLERARRDAAALARGGADGALVENFGDAPFARGRVPAHTVAHMTRAVEAVREEAGLPTGVNVLRNDAESALAVAAAAGGSFVRVNVYIGARVTDQGIVQGRARQVQELRRRLAPDVRVVADVRVKHSAAAGEPRPLEVEVEEAAGRGLADAVVVTGPATGRPPEPERLRRAAGAAGDAPVLAGSGVTAESVAQVLAHARGVIVGTALEEGGRTGAPVSGERVRAFVEAARGAG